MSSEGPQRPSVSSRDAASMLGVVERTVLLHLQQGLLKGSRHGRRWLVFVDSIQLHPNFVRRSLPALAMASAGPPPHTFPSAPAPPPTAAADVAAAPPSPVVHAPLHESVPAKRPRRDWSFMDLTALRALTELATRVAQALSGAQELPPTVREGALGAALDAARHGAAGYHAWTAVDKTRLYARAREHLAMAAVSLRVAADLCDPPRDGLRVLALELEQLAPALGALARSGGRRDT